LFALTGCEAGKEHAFIVEKINIRESTPMLLGGTGFQIASRCTADVIFSIRLPAQISRVTFPRMDRER
jgi:hypothetical protein